jgi:hypothetical protein
MPRVGIEAKILAFEGVKTVRALDLAATVYIELHNVTESLFAMLLNVCDRLYLETT